MKAFALFSLVVLGCSAVTTKQKNRFPDDFIFGASTASYQIEGAWNDDGKSENIWDHMTHSKPWVIADRSNGDIAADSYHNYKRDVEMMRELGLDAYRFSISWPRLLPSGFTNFVNPAGVDFYNNYINEMLKYNITPIVTLYHWDLPQKLQDLGGFLNPLFVSWFEDYARTAFELFGDRVKYWITFNEAKQICYQGYGSTVKIPMMNLTGIGGYLCTKHYLLAHAKAYHLYHKEFKPTQGGVIGLATAYVCFDPATDSEEDVLAAELLRQADWGIYSDPIFSPQGGYPRELEEIVAKKSAEQGYPRSRMPPLSEEEKELIKGSADFLGVNIYTGFLVSATDYKTSLPVPSAQDITDIDVGYYGPDEWMTSTSGNNLKLAPKCMYKMMTLLKEIYNDPPIMITENGWSTTTGLDDKDRVMYYRAAWDDLLDAMDEGVNIIGYMAWSLLDNFEWMWGYTQRYGMYEVDFSSPARTRTPRKSAFVYKELIKSKVVDYSYEPELMTEVMSIDEGN